MISPFQPFQSELAALGLPVALEPINNGPTPPVDIMFPTLYLELPTNQMTLLLASDGCDPTHMPDVPVPPGGEARRLFSRLKAAGLISAWHAFNSGVHVQLTQDQAQLWFSHIDWLSKTISTAYQQDGHRFA